MTEKKSDKLFNIAPLTAKMLTGEPNLYAWARKWFILNTLATLAGAVTGLAALIIAIIALTS